MTEMDSVAFATLLIRQYLASSDKALLRRALANLDTAVLRAALSDAEARAGLPDGGTA